MEQHEIFQCLIVRADPNASGLYTILAENRTGKKRFEHYVDFKTKYSTIHYPLIRHADKKNFVEEILEMLPKEQQQEGTVIAPDGAPVSDGLPMPEVKEKGEIDATMKEGGVQPELLAEKLAEGVEPPPQPADLPSEDKDEKKKEKKSKSKSKSKHRKSRKKSMTPETDDDLINDGESETEELVDMTGVSTPSEAGAFIARTREALKEPITIEEPEPFVLRYSKNRLTFSGELRDQTVFEGQTVKMLCAVSGPLPIIKWLKNGKPVPWSETVRNLSGDGLGSVIIDKIKKIDAGVYTCSAKNSSGECTTEARIKVIPKIDIPSKESKPSFTRVLGEFYRICEDDLILDAHVRGVPDPKIKWYKDGIEILETMDDRYMFTKDGDGGYTLRIHHPNKTDSGLYAVEAVNSVGKEKISHKVNFQEHHKHTHPQFLYHKESFMKPQKIAIEKEEIPAVQEAGQTQQSGAPTSNGTDNSGSQASSNGSSDPSGGSMMGGSGGDGNGDDDKPTDLPNSHENDTEEEEEVEKPKRVAKAAPRRRRFDGPAPKEPFIIRDSKKKCSIEVKLKDIIEPAGKTIKLHCVISGPEAKTRWFKNGKPLEWTTKVKNLSKDGYGIVTIEKAAEIDSGIYKCIAANSFNQAETEAKVTIYANNSVKVKPTFTRICGKYLTYMI